MVWRAWLLPAAAAAAAWAPLRPDPFVPRGAAVARPLVHAATPCARRAPHSTDRALRPRRRVDPVMALPLWPSTLGRFWGAHALAWCGGCLALLAAPGGALAPLARAGLGALSMAQLALAVLLYRSDEEAGASLAAAAAAYFASYALLLRAAAAAPPRAALAAVALRRLSTWHAALALGAAGFALKAYLKDRLFSRGHLAAATAAASSRLPLLAFVNRRSGAKLGLQVVADLEAARAARSSSGDAELGIVDLAGAEPTGALREFAARHAAFRVLVCGGDGTVTWVLSAIEAAALPCRPPLAVVPLGTGNDISRVLGWGKHFRAGSLRARLADVDASRAVEFDRWDVNGTMPEGCTSRVMTNYLSLGVDARAALAYARLAAARPRLFRLRLLNKLMYILLGAPELIRHSYRPLPDKCELVCDGETVPIPPHAEGLMVLNTPSYGGGSDLWDAGGGAPLPPRQGWLATPPQPPSVADGYLEVVAVGDVVHLACSLGGLSSGIRLCQGRVVSLRVPRGGVPLQIDGEPFNVGPTEAGAPTEPEPFDVRLSLRGRGLLLGAPARGGAAGPSADLESGAAEVVIDEALAAGDLSGTQRDALLRALAERRGF